MTESKTGQLVVLRTCFDWVLFSTEFLYFFIFFCILLIFLCSSCFSRTHPLSGFWGECSKVRAYRKISAGLVSPVINILDFTSCTSPCEVHNMTGLWSLFFLLQCIGGLNSGGSPEFQQNRLQPFNIPPHILLFFELSTPSPCVCMLSTNTNFFQNKRLASFALNWPDDCALNCKTCGNTNCEFWMNLYCGTLIDEW